MSSSRPDSAFANEFLLVHALVPAIVQLVENAGGTWAILNEHTVIGRIPDVTALRLNLSALRERLHWRCNPLTEPELRALRALRRDRATSLGLVARRMRVGEAFALKVLRGLMHYGLVERTASGSFVRRVSMTPIVDRAITFEAKRSDWRGALLQARAHQTFADISYVAYDAAFKQRFERAREIYERQGIGLLEVHADDGRTRLGLRAKKSRLISAFARALNAERALARLLGRSLRPLPQTRLPGALASSAGQVEPRFVGPLAKETWQLLAEYVCGPGADLGSPR